MLSRSGTAGNSGGANGESGAQTDALAIERHKRVRPPSSAALCFDFVELLAPHTDNLPATVRGLSGNWQSYRDQLLLTFQ
jgi:hypothetical protein